MKRIMNYLSMAVLALVGAVMTGCSSDDITGEQPQGKANVVTLTTTVNFDDADNAATRALDIDYTNKKVTKTFAEGDQVALVYENTSGNLVKAVSQALDADDITNDGKSARLTFTLTDPADDKTVYYYYPAALVSLNDDGNPVIQIGTQDGTLAGIESLDYAYNTGDMSGTTLPSVTLENKFAIVAFTLKDADGTNDITATITGMTISAGAETYTVARTAAAGPVYVIMRPTDNDDIHITATDGTRHYAKDVTGKTWAANNFYQQGLRMEVVAAEGHALSASAVGEVVGTDGLAYAVADKDNLPSGVTAVGMVAYKSGESGLVIALADEASKMKWDMAMSAAGAAAHKPAVSGYPWKLPTWDEWKQMFEANGGNATEYTGLNTAITNAGGTPLQEFVYCWSSRVYDSNFAWQMLLRWSKVDWFPGNRGADIDLVRACFAFNGHEPAATSGHALTASVVGEVVGTDGLAYADKRYLPSGVTAAGMVAHKDGETGLVIALADEPGKMDWTTAIGAPAAHTPALSGYSWHLPTYDEWNNMINGNTGLNTAIINAGGTALEVPFYYWTSTVFPVDGSSNLYVRTVFLRSDGSVDWNIDLMNSPNHVRACFAFGKGRSLSSSALGEVVGSNGLAYADKSDLPAGVTAAGMVAYKDGTHGLVIALTDEASKMNWNTAMSAAAAHTPAVTGYSWKLPTWVEWKQMFLANGGDERAYYSLSEPITHAGGTALQSYSRYWSSSEDDVDASIYAWVFSTEYKNWERGHKGHLYLVRACLAF